MRTSHDLVVEREEAAKSRLAGDKMVIVVEEMRREGSVCVLGGSAHGQRAE